MIFQEERIDFFLPFLNSHLVIYLKKKLILLGFGLSYTSFEYSNLTVSQSAIVPCESIEISFIVQNTGQRRGDEVCQAYLSLLDATVPAPIVQLVGFERVSLGVGQSTTVSMSIDYEQMSVYLDDGTQVIQPGSFSIGVGGGQPKYYEGSLSATVNIVAEAQIPTSLCQQ
jgi:beta-glucosidase